MTANSHWVRNRFHLALAVGQRDVADVVGRVAVGQLDVHVVVVLGGRAAGAQAQVLVQHVGDPEDALALLDLDGVEVEAGAALVQADGVGQADGGGDQQERRLRVGRAPARKRAMPSRACTLSRSVLRMASSEKTAMAFLR